MPRWAPWATRHTLGSALALGLGATLGRAQAPPTPPPLAIPRPDRPAAPVSTGPTSYGWPGANPANSPVLQTPSAGLPAPTPLMTPGQPTPTSPQAGTLAPMPALLESNPAPAASGGQPADVFLAPNGKPPLPGTLEDTFNQELAARRLFRDCGWDGVRYTLFPSTLLWQPPIALLRDPRMSVIASTYNNYVNTYTIDNSIGGTIGFFRQDITGADLSFQQDLFAVVHTRLSPDDLIASDYRFGFPLSFRRGDWTGKIAYEHTSAHLGDEYLRNTGRLPINFSKNEVVFGLSRYVPEIWLRLWGQYSYAFTQDLVGRPETVTAPDGTQVVRSSGKPDPSRFDAGFEIAYPYATGFTGAPYLAASVEANGLYKYNPNVVAQVGWRWHNPFQRLANVRVYGQYYSGHSQFGQFYFEKEHFFAVGLAGDF